MLDAIFSFLFLVIACIIGNFFGNLLFNYSLSKSLKSSIFSKSDFLDIDDDFFGDSNDSSITDIPSPNTDIPIDSRISTDISTESNISNVSKPNYF